MTFASSSEHLLPTILPWIGVLVGLLIIGVVVVWCIRRSFAGDRDVSTGGFTLHDLREMHAAGELSDEEFERAREAMISRVRESVREDADGAVEAD